MNRYVGMLVQVALALALTLARVMCVCVCVSSFWVVVVLLLLLLFYANTYFFLQVSAYKEKYLTTDQRSYVSKMVDVKNVVLSKVDSPDAGFFNAFNKQYLGYAAYVLSCVDMVVLCLLTSMRENIGTGVGIIREASRAVQDMPLLLLFPVLPNFLILGLTFVWMYGAACIASIADFDNVVSNFTDPVSSTAR